MQEIDFHDLGAGARYLEEAGDAPSGVPLPSHEGIVVQGLLPAGCVRITQTTMEKCVLHCV